MLRYLIPFAAILALCAPAVADPAFSSTQFTQTISSAVASGTTYKQDVHTAPLQHFALQVKGTGAAPSSWDVRLEGSIDGVNYANLVQNATGDGDGSIKFSTTVPVNFAPVNFFRTYVKAVSLGSATAITVSVLGTQ